VLLALAGLVALAAGAWFGWHTFHGSDGGGHAAVRVCVTPTAAPSPAAPAEVTLNVVNATQRAGLAHRVAAQLKARGFHIAHVGNTTATVTGTATVTYPAGGERAARSVAEQVSGATITQGTGRAVTLALGPQFHALASADEVAAARTHDLQSASPRPAVCSSS
jgi:acetolactate synthase regulatory subunit